MKCPIESCGRPSKNRTTQICDTHYRRRLNGLPMEPAVQTYFKQPEGLPAHKRECSICHWIKHVNEFYQNGNGRQSWCKACRSSYNKARNAQPNA